MKTYFNLKRTFLFLFIIGSLNFSYSQDIVNDTICVNLGDMIDYDIMANDPIGSVGIPVFLLSPSNCFSLGSDGRLFFTNPDETCCGKHYLEYTYEGLQEFGLIEITVKCPKPDCVIINLDELDLTDPAGGLKPTINACENTITTYTTSYASSNTYTWTVTAGTYTIGINPATIEVIWANAGPGTIQLDIFDGSSTTSTTYCIEVLASPIADFMPLTACTCLNSPISFQNNSIGASSYLWDFGDGNTSIQYEPTHMYDNPGIYEVTLYVSSIISDINGNPLCCCSDSLSLEVEIDPNPGPEIYWISTLCPGDTSKYWTDNLGCANTWSVEDANGSPVSFTSVSNDTICVVWGDGPYGVVTMQASGCPGICDKPVSTIVPIISTVSTIVGQDTVCEFSEYRYDLPKWPSVWYDWSVTGGTVISGNGTHSAMISWGAAGPGTIHVDYYSDFLGGLPGHDLADCMGIADLNVTILPEYTLSPPNPNIVCVGDISTLNTSHPSAGFTWEVNPIATINGQGTYMVDIIWPAPGSYEVLVYPTNQNIFCNDSLYAYFTVLELEKPDSISGEVLICPNETEIYFGHTDTPNTGLKWDVVGGTPSTYLGNPISVTWNNSGPYSLALSQYQLTDPECFSDTVQLNIIEKQLIPTLTLTGNDACVNTIESYSILPRQPDGTSFEWTVSLPNKGSIIAGNNTPNADIQWNNSLGSAIVSCKVKICDDSLTLTLPVTIHPDPIPTITQIGFLCPGVSAILDAGSGYSTYQWSYMGLTTQTISITSEGTYLVTVTDANGCTGVDTYEAFEVDGPVADITTPDFSSFCAGSGAVVTMHTVTNPNYTFDWYCNGTYQSTIPSTQSFLQHTDDGIIGTWQYYVVVTDNSTNCQTVSDYFYVYQTDCTGGGGDPCEADTHILFASNTNLMPYCNQVQLSVTSSNVTLTSWNYGDPFGSYVSGPLSAPIFSYSKAAYFVATITGQVPNLNPPPANCEVSRSTSICVPLAASFECTFDCLGVMFTDMSTYLDGHTIVAWNWNFGDSNTATSPNPSHTYASGGTYNVTLEVTDGTGCKAQFIKTINVNPPPSASFTMNPNPACVNESVTYTPSSTSTIISYDWNFGDGSSNGAMSPQHAYTSSGSYTVTLVVTDENGCTASASSSILIHPEPVMDTIQYSPSLIICEGESVLLTAPPGASFYWNTTATSPSISVTTSGIYAVTVTDVNNCSYSPDSVDVTVIPTIDAIITGDTIICDNGCVTLSANSGFGFTYQWFDQFGSSIGGATNQTFTVCAYLYYPSVSVEITDANGCMATSPLVNISLATSPPVSISVMGDQCEGNPNILNANPILPDVVYTWSNSSTGTSITVFQAGTYTVLATDTLTGCVNTANVVINPIPDLCILPSGCYEVCNPDTICGPPGLFAYQWNMNGLPIASETNQCLIVTQSGSYSLTGTNTFLCSATSDTLILTVIECCEDEDTDVTAIPSTTEPGCCWDLSYSNAHPAIHELIIHTGDADINFNNVFGALQVTGSSLNSVTLTSMGGSSLPTGNLNNFLTLCLDNVTAVPAQVLIDWIGYNNEVICQDTLLLDCPIEPDCIYLASDSIWCENDQVYYTMEICNSSSNTFPVGFIDIQEFTPAGISVVPSSITLGTPLMPGDCQTFVVQLNGSNIANQDFCFNLLGHEYDPILVDTALCCSLDTTYCVMIPGCSPCDSVFVEDIIVSANDSCCYDIILNNYYQDNLFTGINLCVLTGGSSILVNNPAGNSWTTNISTGTIFSLDYGNTAFPHMPLGQIPLPEICINESIEAHTLVEIKWMNGDLVECRDTVDLFCAGDCGYLENLEVLCDGNGGWIFQTHIYNNSPHTMESAFIGFTDPLLSAYETTVVFPSLPPGGSYGPISFTLGPPASDCDDVTIVVSLHESGHDNLHANCCNFYTTLKLPECATQANCVCDAAFEDAVEAGIHLISVSSGYTATFETVNSFSDCDVVVWEWVYANSAEVFAPGAPVTHTFPGPGEYSVCIMVIRTEPNGTQCEANYCTEVTILAESCPVDELLVGDVLPGLYQVSNNITAYGRVESDVTFQANDIDLLSGFTVDLGTEFLAEINPCTSFSNSPTSMIQYNAISKVAGIYLNLETTKSIQIKIKSMLGDFEQTVGGKYHLESGQHSINLSLDGFQKGIYYILLEGKDADILGKVLIE